MADWHTILVVSLYAIWWPFDQLLKTLVFLLAPIWTLVSFTLLPFIHLVQTIITIITFPLKGAWLDRIETLYVYLGTAALIGCFTGVVVFIVFKFISSSLDIDSSLVPQPQKRARTTAEFQAARRENKERSFDSSLASTPVVLKKVPGARHRGLMAQAIIEEEDSDF
ncbi:hypothetical protein DE146DRAFT_178806 [Phaeosphaeria sp. MPI-PUGE-AT-0046c]|nr:hypothetical protein DE146DRAFT_178806 [Phaeosphaeria sp. MPI-PUGE-AT-0046c]